MWKASNQQGENERQWRKKEHKHATKSFVSTYDISSIKKVTGKFAVVKNDDKKNMYKKRDARAKLCFAN